MGSGFSGLASPLLITELAHPCERGKVSALYNTQYYFGAFLGGWITFGTLYINSNWAWKLPSLLQSAPSFVQVLLVLLLPESPRWLMSRGKDEQALRIIAKYHANGDENDALVRYEFAEMQATIAKGEQKGRWSELFRTKGNRHRAFICLACGVFSQFSGTSLTAYYLHNILVNIGIDDPKYQNKLNGFILMVNMIEAWFWALMVDRVGRRPLFLIASSGMCCTFAIWIGLTAAQLQNPGETGFGKGVIAMIFFHNFFYNFAWYVLPFRTILMLTSAGSHSTSPTHSKSFHSRSAPMVYSFKASPPTSACSSHNTPFPWASRPEAGSSTSSSKAGSSYSSLLYTSSSSRLGVLHWKRSARHLMVQMRWRISRLRRMRRWV